MGSSESSRQKMEQNLVWKRFQNLIETVSSSLSFQEVIQRLADGVVNDLAYPVCYVNLYHPEEDNLSIVGFAPRGKLLGMAEKMLKLKVNEIRFPFRAEKGSTYARIFRGEEFVIKDYGELVSPVIPPSVAYAAQKVFGINSILVVPLRSKEELLGVFLVGSPKEDFSGDERETLNIIARNAAIAMEKALLHEALDRAKSEAEAMAEIAQDLSASLDLQRTLAKIVKYARTLCQCDLSVIALFNKKSGYATITEWEGTRTDVYRNLKIYPGKGLGGRVLETGRGWVTDDFLRDPRLTRDYDREGKAEGIRCNMAVPIFSQQEISGILWVANRTASPFTPNHQRILQKLSNHAGIAILNANLYEDSKVALKRQRSLVKILAAINTSFDRKEILSTIARFATELCHGDAAAIYGQSEEGSLSLQASINLSPELEKMDEEETRLSPEDAILSKTIVSAYPVEVFDPSVEPDFPPNALTILKREGFRGFVTMGLTKAGKELGALTVFRRQPQHFSPEELDFLSILTQHTAAALEKSLLNREMDARNARLSLLSRIATSLRPSLDSEGIFHSMIAEINRAVPFQRAALYTFQPDQDTFLLQCLFEKQSFPELVRRKEISASETPASIAFFSLKPFFVKNVQESDLASVQELKELCSFGIRSLLYVPILADDSCLGVLGLESINADGFRPNQIQLLKDMSPYLALAFKYTRLFSRLNQTLREMEKTQEQVHQVEKLKSLGEMASGIAHDFNNLLATILVRAELLERKLSDPDAQEWARIIQRTALDGAETVRRLRSFYKRETDRQKTNLDLNQIIEEVIHRIEPRWKDQAQEKGIIIEFEKELQQPLQPVLGNAAELGDVFTNLIFNAIDALPQGGKIYISTRMRDVGLPWERVEVLVIDNGIGMSEEVLEQAFDPFFTTKGPSGSGLGLSVSYGIIKGHQGEISVQSSPGQGTSVLIHLSSAPTLRENKDPSTPGFDLPPLRILVIEDERELAKGLQQMLSLFGHHVDLAFGGEEGVRRSTEENYDLIFTDLGMPDLPGLDVAEAIKGHKPSIPILLMTGWGDQVDASQAKSFGIAGIVAKPFRIGDILRAIKEILPDPGAGPHPSESSETDG